MLEALQLLQAMQKTAGLQFHGAGTGPIRLMSWLKVTQVQKACRISRETTTTAGKIEIFRTNFLYKVKKRVKINYIYIYVSNKTAQKK